MRWARRRLRFISSVIRKRWIRRSTPHRGSTARHSRDEIVYVSGGEGMTSQGEFFEALNAACLKRLPVLFLVEDNGWAISVPVEVQTAGGSISRLVRDYPNLHVEECDGTDPLVSYDALQRAAEHCRARKGPALVHAHVTRPYSHSLSDDEKLYKTAEEREEEAHRDPIPKFGLFLVREGILDEKELERVEAEVDREILEATDFALAAELPGEESILKWVCSPDVDPTSSQFESEPKTDGEPKTMVEMVAATLADGGWRAENDGGDGRGDAGRRDGARCANPGVWGGCGRLQPREEPGRK